MNHETVQLAMRARLLTLLVCTTGATDLSATATGYHRAAGSFVADGFAAGMEVTPAGFASAAVGVITKVTATDIDILGGRTIDAVNSGRTLSVGVPSTRFLENRALTPTAGVPYLDEQYMRGPNVLGGIGPFGRIAGEPMFLPRINVPENTGIQAATRYTDAVIALFPPSLVIPVTGETIHIRGDEAPYGGQLLPTETGFAGVLCTVPLRVYAINSI